MTDQSVPLPPATDEGGGSPTPAPAPPIKPGVKTTEFALTAIGSVVMLGIATWLFLDGWITSTEFVTLAIATQAGGTGLYAVLRTVLKVKLGVDLPALPDVAPAAPMPPLE